MDTELLVEERIDDGRALIARLVGDGFDVSVALWVKTSEEGLWFLYIGSTSVGVRALADDYKRIYTCLSRIPNVSIALSEIKLVHATNPIAQQAIAVRDQFQARIPTRYHGKRLGNISIEEAYIYPRAIGPMTRNEVLQTAVGLMNRTGTVQPSIVTFSNGSSIRAIPIGINMNPAGSISLLLRDADTGTERPVSADDVTNIQ